MTAGRGGAWRQGACGASTAALPGQRGCRRKQPGGAQNFASMRLDASGGRRAALERGAPRSECGAPVGGGAILGRAHLPDGGQLDREVAQELPRVTLAFVAD